jgi:hypothetical protein
VVEDDEEHRHGPETLDVGAELPVAGGRARLVAGYEEAFIDDC